MSPRPPIRFHRHRLSGHCHRVELLLAMLGVPYEAIDVDLAHGAHRRPGFLALNPFAQVPVIEDDDVVLADSNAILVWLAKRHDPSGRWLPDDALTAAQVQRWLSAAAGPIAFGPCRARLVTVFGAPHDAPAAIALAQQFLSAMEVSLAGRAFLAADHATIADLACHTYIAHAPEGNVALDDHPGVRSWLARVEALPGFFAMPATRAGLLAA